MRRFLLVGCISLSSFSIAATLPDSGSVSSTHATYDGNALILTGRVVLDHGLGKMTAEEASLQKQEVGKDFPFSVIELRKDVHLALTNSAELLCENAHLDFIALRGVLTANTSSKVIYSDILKKKKELLPFQLRGNSIELVFSKTASGEKYSYEIDTILAQDDVTIDYAELLHLTAGHALYRKPTATAKEFQGIITAYPKEQQDQCRLTYYEDIVDADVIDLNMIDSMLSLLHPKGTIYSELLSSHQKEPMHFSADHLAWDLAASRLALHGNIRVEEKNIGTLTAADQLQLVYARDKNHSSILQTIHTQGFTTLVYRDFASACLHKLTSHGTTVIDRNALCATIESPQTAGRTPADKQIYYEEQEMAVFADRAFLEYSASADTLRPISLQLKGNIRLFSHDPTQPPRCGIADRLNYSLTTRTLILASHPGSKVLFWDESQGLRMSASEVHITYDAENHHRTVKGIGKVQLSLTTEEQQRMKHLFPYYKIAHEPITN